MYASPRSASRNEIIEGQWARAMSSAATPIDTAARYSDLAALIRAMLPVTIARTFQSPYGSATAKARSYVMIARSLSPMD